VGLPEQYSIIRKAFLESIKVLGKNGVMAIVEDLQRHDVFLDDPEFSLVKLHRALKQVVGDEVSTIIIERLLIELDRLCNLRMTTK